MRINVLTPGFTTSNGAALLFPLIIFEGVLREMSIEVRLVSRGDPRFMECDILAIDSKEFRTEWRANTEGPPDLLSSWKDAGLRIFWFDTSDSTGTLQSAVMPFVEKYLKSQILADRDRYKKRIYGGRVISEYYNHTAGVVDEIGGAVDEPIRAEDVSKLGVSWNSGLADYSTYGPLKMGLYRRLAWNRFLRYPDVLSVPATARSNDLSARFGATYSRASVRYQREKISEMLSDRLDTLKLNRRGYMKELKNSKVVISPFGWGEITLKDFEVFLTGGMLMKPSVEHMDTWPNFYEKDATYLAHNWDLSDMEERIEWAIAHDRERQEIAAEGQLRYTEHTSGRDAGEKFATHVSEIFLV
jgi:hypothetical protein